MKTGILTSKTISDAIKKLETLTVEPEKEVSFIMHPFTHFKLTNPEVFYWAIRILNKKYYIKFRKKESKIMDKRTLGGKFIDKKFKDYLKLTQLDNA